MRQKHPNPDVEFILKKLEASGADGTAIENYVIASLERDKAKKLVERNSE